MKFVAFFFQFFPLSAFAAYAFWSGEPIAERWSIAYTMGSVLAILQFILFLALRRPMNRLVLGANLYLVIGSLAIHLGQGEVLRVYGSLRESAILVSMLIVGVVTCLGTRGGFIGASGGEQVVVRRYSFYLLSLTALAVAVSFLLRGNRLMGAVMPIVVLALANRRFVGLASSNIWSQKSRRR